MNLADKITILTNGEKESQLRIDSSNRGKDKKIEINTKEIEAIEGKEKVEEIRFKDKTTLKIDGIFIAMRYSRRYRICQKTRNLNTEKTN